MICHKNCAACCSVISISSPLPGMPNGKPAGIRCYNLTLNDLCSIHEQENYPTVCRNFQMSLETCGLEAKVAIDYLYQLEKLTA
jgi:uncharacterized protein